MFALLKAWYQKYFSDPQALILLIALIGAFLVVFYLGKILAPVLAAIAISFVLDAIVSFLHRRFYCPRWLSVTLVYLLFIGIVVVLVVWLLPLFSRQLSQLVDDVPTILQQFHDFLLTLPNAYPKLFSQSLVNDLIASTHMDSKQLTKAGGWLFSLSLSSVPAIISWLVYVVLVPFLVLFLLKDKHRILGWANSLVATQRGLIDQVLRESRIQVGNYIRGKVLECFIVGIVSYIGFIVFGLNYAPLLAFLVGLSVFIPYVGMVVVTIPVMIVGLLQWGFEPVFFYMLITYFVIQALDGNVLVPLLFSGAVNLHPVAIITAILFFGGVWGFWGLFFAIPLAALVDSVVRAWYRHCQVNIKSV